VLWSENDPADKKRVEQVWFAGAHSNVGGGYPQQGMSLVALDWMMKKAEEQGLRFSPFAREQYHNQHSFADKLYNPRSGFGVFYRWKPRNIDRLCAEKGIAAPLLHISVVERIIQAPHGYAPGNLPANCAIVATEDDPLIDLKKVAQVIAAAHGGFGAPSLVERQWRWIQVGFLAYLSFIFGTLGALVRAILVTPSLPDLFETFPLALITTIGTDPIASSSLLSGMVLGYVLSNVTDKRTEWVYSTFWHRHRAALRDAVRRTPAPAAPAPAAPAPAAPAARRRSMAGV
jgi:hypothetical protein